VNTVPMVSDSPGPPVRHCPRAAFVLLLLGSLAAFGCAQTISGRNPDRQPQASRDATSCLDFKLYRGYLIVVSGSVADLKNLHFLVDTGASESIADIRLVKRLGTAQRLGSLHVLGEISSAGQTVLPRVWVGPVTKLSLPAFVLDLSALEQELGVRIDMLIGLDVLGQRSFSIDYQARRILFGDPHALPLEVSMLSGPPLVSVAARLDGKTLRMLVNTGFPSLLLFAPSGAPTIQEARSEPSSLATNAAGGQLVCQRIHLRSVQVGDWVFDRQTAFSVIDHRDFDGSLPIPGPGFKEVAFDFERHLLGLKR
jgi:predicted aspartyl protease